MEFVQPSQWSGTANVVWKSGIEFGCIMFGRGAEAGKPDTVDSVW